METFDTNVIVRVLVEDDPRQSAKALALWRGALVTDGIFLPKLALAEAIWVLKVSYRFDRQAIGGVVKALLSTEGVNMEDEVQVRRALEAYARDDADFSDYLILEATRVANALPVQTFDRRFARDQDVTLILS